MIENPKKKKSTIQKLSVKEFWIPKAMLLFEKQKPFQNLLMKEMKFPMRIHCYSSSRRLIVLPIESDFHFEIAIWRMTDFHLRSQTWKRTWTLWASQIRSLQVCETISS